MSPLSANDPRIHFIVTCEHASDEVPDSCAALLLPLLGSVERHSVIDWGAKQIASEMAERLSATSHMGRVCRLAVDLNRSIGNPQQFFGPVSQTSELLKYELLENYFIPFRKAVFQEIAEAIARGKQVVHVSVHSFTKMFNGSVRDVDLGILYDPQRPSEESIGRAWIRLLKGILPDVCIRANQPYAGIEDGHTTSLRRSFPDFSYLGFEIELSQALELEQDSEMWSKVLVTTLRKVLAQQATQAPAK